jgi:Zn-dependent M28 family amino/carboxypeptidase
VSSVLEIARLLAKAKKEGNELQRSIIVLFPAAEELGLIGSSYYVRNPVFPLSNTKACVNVDMVGRIDNKYKSTNGDYIYVVNDAKTNGKLLEYVEKANNDNIIVNVEDLNSLFRRSDHYNFAKNDVPAALLTSGLHGDYHTPRDDAELIDFRAMWKRSRFILSLIWSLAN